MDKNVVFELGKMRSLMERIDYNLTPRQAMLNEERFINEAVKEISKAPIDEIVETSSEMFKFLDEIVGFDSKDPNRALNNGRAYISMGYVSDVKLNTTVKRRNPLTNRPKTYNDYSGIGNIAGLVCVTNYNYSYRHRSNVNYDYRTRFIPQRNELRKKYGIPLPKPKSGYDENGMPSGEPIEKKPKDQSLVDKFGGDYNPQNLCDISSKTRFFYPIDVNGRVLRGEDGKLMCLSENDIKRFLAEEDPAEGVNALMKLGTEQSIIDQYAKEFKSLKMDYKNFRADSILYIRGKAYIKNEDGTMTEKRKLFRNKEINKLVDDIKVNPNDMYQIACDRYKELENEDNKK